MKPLTFITGVLLCSSAAIALGLAVVLLIFLLLKGEYPRLNAELGTLLVSTALFAVMTAVCAFSFIALFKEKRWWASAQLLQWGGVASLVWYYWP